MGHLLVFPAVSCAQAPGDVFTLKQTIESALKANIEIKISREETQALSLDKNVQRSNFLPTLKGTYQFKRSKEEQWQPLFGVTTPKEEYTLAATFTQPIFLGFSLHNRYKIAGLGLDMAKIKEKLIRQSVVFEAKKTYFSLLKAQKLLKIAQEAVAQITRHKEVANNFYQVGMTPLNDLLKTEVELANERQAHIVAQNNQEIAKSNFNTLLRRSIHAPVQIKDVLTYSPFENDLEYCLGMAENNRLEIKISDLEIEIAEKELKISQKDYFPSINLQGNYYQLGTDWEAKGGRGINDANSWDITAVASWNFWEWGKSYYGAKEKLSHLSQARYRKTQIHDRIRLEVKQAYLKTKESEKNIATVEKAIEQAKENFRINQERYREQAATSTDVLDAQTLLSRTMTNYYNALYDFKISKASLYLAMGQEALE